MKRFAIVAIGVVSFAGGAFVHMLLAQTGEPVAVIDQIKGKDAKEAATVLLDGALERAGNGSWERIAVGRAWYLGGDKAKGQKVFDAVTTSTKVESSDWFRVGRVYAEADEWEKATKAFDKALEMKPKDDSSMVEYGALAILNNDRAKAEGLFERAFEKNPNEFWHWVTAGGSYVGVHPQ